MTARAKMTLTPEQETLLITLYAKAQPGNPLFFDPAAQDILNQVDYDFTRLHVPYKTVVLVCQRAKKLDAVTRDFLAGHPDGVVIQLGCGLDNRFWRVDDGRVNWYDLDMPPVVELRHRFFTGSERYHLIAASVTDLEWVDMVTSGGRPVLVVAEGLLMYVRRGRCTATGAPTARDFSGLPDDRGCVQSADGALGHQAPLAEIHRCDHRLGHG